MVCRGSGMLASERDMGKFSSACSSETVKDMCLLHVLHIESHI